MLETDISVDPGVDLGEDETKCSRTHLHLYQHPRGIYHSCFRIIASIRRIDPTGQNPIAAGYFDPRDAWMLGSTYITTAVPSAGVEVLVNGNRRAEDTTRSDKATSLLQPCCSSGGCLLDSNFVATTPPPSGPQPALHDRRGISQQSLSPLLLNTASAARSRRWEGNNQRNKNRPHRAASDLVLKVAVMEEVHGVDVSWLHHPNKRMRKVSIAPLVRYTDFDYSTYPPQTYADIAGCEERCKASSDLAVIDKRCYARWETTSDTRGVYQTT